MTWRGDEADEFEVNGDFDDAEDDDIETIVIPQPDYPDETPAEALEDIIRNALRIGEELGGLTFEEVTAVVEKVLHERLDNARPIFKIHQGKIPT